MALLPGHDAVITLAGWVFMSNEFVSPFSHSMQRRKSWSSSPHCSGAETPKGTSVLAFTVMGALGLVERQDFCPCAQEAHAVSCIHGS